MPKTIPSPPASRLIDELAPRFGIDPRAAKIVALGEGGLVNRENDVGDLAGGGSYGPFQLYAQGALPRQFVGNPRAADAWAWSPAGIEYALRKMAESGARGLTGRQAIETIIRKFERPADPDKSVRLALGRLGENLVSDAGGSVPDGDRPAWTVAPVQAGVAGSGRREFAQELLAGMQGGKLDTRALLAAVLAKRAATAAPAADPSPLPRQPPATGPEQGQPGGGGNLDRLLRELGVADAVTSGDRPGAITARGGRSDHSRPGKARDIRPSDPDFPRLVAYAQQNPGAFKDFIFSGLDWFIDEGRRYPINRLNRVDRDNHGGHAHVSVR